MASSGADGDPPYVTHVPIIVDPELSEDLEDLTGTTLWGHMNRANPHWAALVDGSRVVATFTGPHGYVSPTVYGTTPAAPTWNFTAVHVHGTVRKVGSDEETLETVTATVRTFEERFGAEWAMRDSLDYFRRILVGVGAYRIDVSRVDGMFKLSQEQSPDVRERVRRSFAERDTTHHRDIAALMGRLTPNGDH
ncbi:transcriptional regulator [Actinomadura rupiterrae]|nr:transcriptional regulator [Actinomadura rupiterrae]